MLCLFCEGSCEEGITGRSTGFIMYFKTNFTVKICLDRENCFLCRKGVFSEGEGPLGGSIFTGLALDIVISACVLHEQLYFPDLSLYFKYSAAVNIHAWLMQLAGDSQSKELIVCSRQLSLGVLPHY